MSSWGPGPARRVAWVDADPRIQVMRVLCASTDNILSSRGSIATVAIQ